MSEKTEVIHVRCEPEEKTALERQARAAGLRVSDFIRERVWPPEKVQMRVTDGAVNGSDPEVFNRRVNELVQQGIPLATAKRMARLEAKGLRQPPEHHPIPRDEDGNPRSMTERERAELAKRAADISEERGIALPHASALAKAEMFG